jgi:hypothetical protein
LISDLGLGSLLVEVHHEQARPESL